MFSAQANEKKSFVCAEIVFLRTLIRSNLVPFGQKNREGVLNFVKNGAPGVTILALLTVYSVKNRFCLFLNEKTRVSHEYLLILMNMKASKKILVLAVCVMSAFPSFSQHFDWVKDIDGYAEDAFDAYYRGRKLE